MLATFQNPGRRRRHRHSSSKNVWDVFVTVFTTLFMIVAVAMMIFTIVSVTTFDRNDRSLFGYKAFIVRSDSMKATDFAAGDLVLIKEIDPSTLVDGDIIAFRSSDPNTFGETFTHKIRTRTVGEDGEPLFITYGTTTGVSDTYPVTYDRVMGRYELTLRGVGQFFTFMKSVPGYICCILIPFLLLFITQGISSVRTFRRYRAEQLAELQAQRRRELDEMAAERRKLEREREKFAQMQRQLEELKAEFRGKDQN